jgi:filamentous hemagglutinin family protein
MKKLAVTVIFGIIFIPLFSIKTTQAQVVPDNSLGAEKSIVNTTPNVTNIEGGATRGNNLFHSFERFSIPTGNSAIFNNSLEINNIITRVTGSSISNIDGLIGAKGIANLFILNPNGIVFGSNASLNIGGSFFASTANSFKFTDGSIFSANPSQSSPLLTISTPIGLQIPTQGTLNNSAKLSINPEKNLTLVGQEIINSGSLIAPGGDISLEGLRINILPNSLINASSNVNGGGKISIGSNNTQSVYIDKLATIKADALNTGNGGEIKVFSSDSTRAYGNLSAKGGLVSGNGGFIETSGVNFIDVAGIKVDASAVNGLPGTWLLDPRNITLVNGPTTNGQFNGSNPNAFTPDADNSTVSIQDIEQQLSNGTNVTIATGNTGNQEGNITASGFGINTTNTVPVTLTLQAANDIKLDSFGLNSIGDRLNLVLEADTDKSGSGNINITSGGIQTQGGGISFSAPGLISLESLGINSDNSSNIAAAPININTNNLSIKNTQFSSVTKGRGNAANIAITAKNFTISRSTVRTNTEAEGNAGNLTIETDTFRGMSGTFSTDTGVDRSRISRVLPDGTRLPVALNNTGQAGVVNVRANIIDFDNSAITSETGGSGNSGQINVTVRDFLTIRNNAGFTTSTLEGITGSAGKIEVVTKSALFENTQPNVTSGFGTVNRGSGNGGEIILTVTDDLILRNRGGLAIQSIASGGAGKLTLNAKNLLLENAAIAGSTVSAQDAGSIELNIGSGTLRNSNINTNTTGQGNAGRITVKADSFTLENRPLDNNVRIISSILSDTSGSGKGGNIDLQINNTLKLDNASRISASSRPTNPNTPTPGQAGDIQIRAGNLFLLRNSSQVSTTAGNQQAPGDGGNIKITTPLVVTVPNENSDITANAFSGRGGRIEINTQGIFGIGVSPRLTPGNDITAFSQTDPELNGLITINTSGIDPTQGLVELPVAIVDESRRIASGCDASNQNQNQFIVTGRGGLPPSPNDPLTPDAIWEDTRIQGTRGDSQKVTQTLNNSVNYVNSGKIKESFTPAVGWVFDHNGQVRLIGNPDNPGVAIADQSHCYSSK